jgi:hypothetical protein
MLEGYVTAPFTADIRAQVTVDRGDLMIRRPSDGSGSSTTTNRLSHDSPSSHAAR